MRLGVTDTRSNVGVNTADPNATLHVTGTGNFTDDVVFQKNITLTGGIYDDATSSAIEFTDSRIIFQMG